MSGPFKVTKHAGSIVDYYTPSQSGFAYRFHSNVLGAPDGNMSGYSVKSSNTSFYITVGGFNFNLPRDAVISDVSVRWDGEYATSYPEANLSIRRGTTEIGFARARSGSSPVTWYTTPNWTVNDINNLNIRWSYSLSTSTKREIDAFTVSVTYTTTGRLRHYGQSVEAVLVGSTANENSAYIASGTLLGPPDNQFATTVSNIGSEGQYVILKMEPIVIPANSKVTGWGITAITKVPGRIAISTTPDMAGTIAYGDNTTSGSQSFYPAEIPSNDVLQGPLYMYYGFSGINRRDLDSMYVHIDYEEIVPAVVRHNATGTWQTSTFVRRWDADRGQWVDAIIERTS